MALTIEVDERLVEKVMRKLGTADRNAAVAAALHEYIKDSKYEDLLKLKGSKTIDPDYDYKKMREVRF